MERTIRVTGTGNLSLKPDITVITLEMRGVRETYEDTIEASAKELNMLKCVLEKLGIEKNTIKTMYFNIDTHYKSVKNSEGKYDSVFDGFKYHQTVRFTFDVDNELLGKVLYEVAHLPTTPEITINYSIKDIEDAKNKLLASAVEDAQKKAEIIANAANVELGEILDINYSWLNFEFISRPYDMDLAYCCKGKQETGAYHIDIEPDDIERRDNITVVYKIK